MEYKKVRFISSPLLAFLKSLKSQFKETSRNTDLEINKLTCAAVNLLFKSYPKYTLHAKYSYFASPWVLLQDCPTRHVFSFNATFAPNTQNMAYINRNLNK